MRIQPLLFKAEALREERRGRHRGRKGRAEPRELVPPLYLDLVEVLAGFKGDHVVGGDAGDGLVRGVPRSVEGQRRLPGNHLPSEHQQPNLGSGRERAPREVLTKTSVCCGLKFHCMLACRSALKVTLMTRSGTGVIVSTWSALCPATAMPPRPDAWLTEDNLLVSVIISKLLEEQRDAALQLSGAFRGQKVTSPGLYANIKHGRVDRTGLKDAHVAT